MAARAAQIAAVFGDWWWHGVWGRAAAGSSGSQALTDARAEKLRRLLTQLGPAFVKVRSHSFPGTQASKWHHVCHVERLLLHCSCPHRALHCAPHAHHQPLSLHWPPALQIGQAISSRPDVAPPEFLRELEKLQVQGLYRAEPAVTAPTLLLALAPLWSFCHRCLMKRQQPFPACWRTPLYRAGPDPTIRLGRSF